MAAFEKSFPQNIIKPGYKVKNWQSQRLYLFYWSSITKQLNVNVYYSFVLSSLNDTKLLILEYIRIIHFFWSLGTGGPQFK